MNKQIIVLGSLNTDIIGLGVDKLLGQGELTFSGQLKIGAGGKSRNIAQMIAALQDNPSVSMIGVTSKDPMGLWKVPFDALENYKVDTSNIKIFDFEKTGKFPGVALIPVDREGHNQIYVLPGISNDFSSEILEDAEELFKNAKIVVFTLEMPETTILKALELAQKYDLKVMFDPGGISDNFDKSIIEKSMFFIKPNEHEVRILTGVDVIDFDSAREAGELLLDKGIQNAMITLGEKGAYFFNKEHQIHIPVTDIKIISNERDSTGCGDQSMAAFAASILEGENIVNSAKKAVFAGTLQYFRNGINPLKRDELVSFEL